MDLGQYNSQVTVEEDKRKPSKATDSKELERQLMSACVAKNEREWWAKKRIEELQDFAIWMTGCGYDFCQHKHFCDQRDKLLKGHSKPNVECQHPEASREWLPLDEQLQWCRECGSYRTRLNAIPGSKYTGWKIPSKETKPDALLGAIGEVADTCVMASQFTDVCSKQTAEFALTVAKRLLKIIEEAK